MKKFLAVFFALSIASLCACGTPYKSETNKASSESGLSKNANSEEITDSKESPSINEDEIKNIGKSITYMLNEYGEISSVEWLDGPVYQFEKSEKWYAFSEYDPADNGQYIPKGVCTHVFTTFKDLVDSPDGEYDIDVFKEAVSSKLVMYYNESDMINVYEANCKGYTIEISEIPKKGITADSSVTITKNTKEE